MSGNLFIASPIRGQEALRELDSAWDRTLELMPPGTWVKREEQPHITLRHLGGTGPEEPRSDEALRALEAKLARTAGENEPIPLLLGYLHAFPGVLWASVGGTEEALERLRRLRLLVRLDVASAEARELHVERDRYLTWLPHITLGKFDPEETGRLTRALRDSEFPRQVEFHVESLESVTHPDGRKEYVPAGPPAALRAQAG